MESAAKRITRKDDIMKLAMYQLKADDREGLVYCEFDPMDSRVVRKLKPYTQLRRTELYE